MFGKFLKCLDQLKINLQSRVTSSAKETFCCLRRGPAVALFAVQLTLRVQTVAYVDLNDANEIAESPIQFARRFVRLQANPVNCMICLLHKNCKSQTIAYLFLKK